MGQKSGDKGRYYRKRNKKYAKRMQMRALRKAALGAEPPAEARATESQP